MSTPNQRLTLDELIDLEAKQIARDILERKLMEQDLPLPESGLDIHLNQLIQVNPQIVSDAKVRVEKRLDAYSLALKAIGIDSTPIEALKL